MGKINLQMYSFMDGTHNDNKENFKLAADMGYDGVELFGPNFEIPAGVLKTYLNELGLEAVSMHAPGTNVVEQMIPYAKEVGLKFIGIGMEVLQNEDEVHAFAKTLNRLGKVCSENGLILTYHNHTQEFAPCGEKHIMDVLLKETNEQYVSIELDAGWCAAAGYDPVEFVQEYAPRVKLIHIKESSEVVGPQPPMDFSSIEKDENGAPIFTPEIKNQMDKLMKINCKAGVGLVDWNKLKEVADANGCQAYIVEREYSEGDRVEELKADIRYYRTVI